MYTVSIQSEGGRKREGRGRVEIGLETSSNSSTLSSECFMKRIKKLWDPDGIEETRRTMTSESTKLNRWAQRLKQQAHSYISAPYRHQVLYLSIIAIRLISFGSYECEKWVSGLFYLFLCFLKSWWVAMSNF